MTQLEELKTKIADWADYYLDADEALEKYAEALGRNDLFDAMCVICELYKDIEDIAIPRGVWLKSEKDKSDLFWWLYGQTDLAYRQMKKAEVAK